MVVEADDPDTPDTPETPDVPVRVIRPWNARTALLDCSDYSSSLSAPFDDDALSIGSAAGFSFLPDHDEDDSDSDAPSLEPEDDMNSHFAHLLRVMDKNHKRELDSRDLELAKMRLRLNEVDQAYRREMYQRDLENEELRGRIEGLQTETKRLVEEAREDARRECHLVEDSWEIRWKERDEVMQKRLRRLDDENEVLRGTNLELIRRLAEEEYRKGELDEKTHRGVAQTFFHSIGAI
ncbi:hypothetical protein KEM55_003294 [Ascosphaera atra]|nr:hypothetical protein KEM55_003294 [Ascosphaera atra]